MTSACTACYYALMISRRAQSPVHFRSDKAAAILRRESRKGLSQARMVEEALEEKYGPADLEIASEKDIALRMKAIRSVLAKIDRNKIPSMAEFDAFEYGDSGSPQ